MSSAADFAVEDVHQRLGASAALMDLIAIRGYYVLVSMTLNVGRTPVPGGGKPQLPIHKK